MSQLFNSWVRKVPVLELRGVCGGRLIVYPGHAESFSTAVVGCRLSYLSPPGRESLGHMEGRDTNPACIGLAKKVRLALSTNKVHAFYFTKKFIQQCIQ